MPCPPLTKNLLLRIVTLGFYVIEQPGCWYNHDWDEHTILVYSLSWSWAKREFSVLIYTVFANSGGVWIYNIACHSTEILVTGIQLVSAHWSLVMQAVLAPPQPVCLLNHNWLNCLTIKAFTEHKRSHWPFNHSLALPYGLGSLYMVNHCNRKKGPAQKIM